MIWDVRPLESRQAVAAAKYLGVPWPADAATARQRNAPMLFHCQAFADLLRQTGTPVRRREESVEMFAARLKKNRTTNYAICSSVVRQAVLAGMVEAVGTVQDSQDRARATAQNQMLQFTGDPTAVEATRRLGGWVTNIL